METLKFNLSAGNGVSLTAYLLDSSKEMPNMLVRPGVLVIPGGGYHFCSDREAEPVAMAFAAAGYNTFVLRYSIGKENAKWPAPLRDAEEALSMIYENAEKWHTDKAKVAAIGFSAGGHLAAMLSVAGEVRPSASILVYPCILKSIGEVLAVPVPSADECVDGKTPPTFIISAREDTSVPIANSLAYASALDKAGVPFEMHIFQQGSHGFSIATRNVFSNEQSLAYNAHLSVWVDLCIKWLDKTFN